MENLLKQHVNLVDQMKLFKKNVTKQPLERRTKHWYLVRIEGWNELWLEFENHYKKIKTVISENDNTLKNFNCEVFKATKLEFCNFKSELQDLFEACLKPSKNNTPNLNYGKSNKVQETYESSCKNWYEKDGEYCSLDASFTKQ